MAGNHGDNANSNSEADITVTFAGDCTDFHVESSKDISFVSVNYEDENFTYEKFEDSDIRTEDHDSDGDDPDGSDTQDFSREGDTTIKSIVVKSGSTMLVFNCQESDDGSDTQPEPDSEEEPECSDGEDNDGDGEIDHPNDDGCETPDDDDERPPGDDDGDGDGEGPQGDETCDDGEDNDGDGLVDDDDPDCNEGAQDGEFCDDGEDNDGDGKVDEEDEDCQEGPQGDETCDDGVDNDGDGKVDEEDEDCNEGAQDGEFCDDGVDNDGDGEVDTEDEDCEEADELSVETVEATNVTNSSATLNGNLTDLGEHDNATVYFEWRESGTENWSTTPDQERTETGEFDADIEELESNTTYEFRAIAEADNETANGSILTFTTDEGPDLGTCEQDGAFQENTVANEAFGTENEEGPISSGIHDSEEEFQDLEPLVHEGSCVVATVDNNAA